jgi:RNA polymerase sigma-70 factor (ECF subfamily)
MAAQPDATLFQDDAYLSELREQMLKFAVLQLRDKSQAEDAVQDALISAYKNCKAFSGKCAFKTWVFAILKNKIVDLIRSKNRFVAIADLQENSEDQDDFSFMFDKAGHWQAEHSPSAWNNPEGALKQQQFWLVFETCLNKLPGSQAQPFMMREFIGLDSDEICKELTLTTSNLHVLLYRARMSLQKCLEKNWFKEGRHA